MGARRESREPARGKPRRIQTSYRCVIDLREQNEQRICPGVHFVFLNVVGRTWFISQATQFQRHKCKLHFWLVSHLKYNLGQAERGSSVAHAAMVANVILQNVCL